MVGGKWLAQSPVNPDPLTLFEVPMKYGIAMVNTVRNPAVNIERGVVTLENQNTYDGSGSDSEDEVPYAEHVGRPRYILSEEQHEALLDGLAESS